MKIQTRPTRQLANRINKQPWEPPNHHKEIFLEGAKIGLQQVGLPALMGLVVPVAPAIAGAVAGAGVGYLRGRETGQAKQLIVVSSLLGLMAGHTAGQFGMWCALAMTGISAAAFGAMAVKQDMDDQ